MLLAGGFPKSSKSSRLFCDVARGEQDEQEEAQPWGPKNIHGEGGHGGPRTAVIKDMVVAVMSKKQKQQQ